MSRQGWYHDVEEAIKACDEALEKSFLARDFFESIWTSGGNIKVVKVEEIEKIKKILKNITIISMPF